MESYRSISSREGVMDTYKRWVKRELEEMQSNPSDDFKCLALTEDPYDWQFAIRGPNGTEFEGGIYHGRIQFSKENPFKRPIFTLLTENGRFKTQTEIGFCEFLVQPFGVRVALCQLIAKLSTYPDGTLGSVEYDKEERRVLAIKSREAAPRYGTSERQKLIDEIHQYMLSKVPPVPSNGGGDIRAQKPIVVIEYDKEERLALAIKSREAVPRYGTAERQKLIDEIHEYMLSKVPHVPSNRGGDVRVNSQNDRGKIKRAKRTYIFGNTINS